jgi:glycosidase
MIRLRKKHAAFGGTEMQWLETDNPAVAAYLREHDGDVMLIFNNLSDGVQTIRVPAEYQKTCQDLFTGSTCALKATLDLQPYAYHWMQMQQ